MKKQCPMLVNDGRAVSKLQRIVEGMVCGAAERDDLLQEALMHLWVTQNRRPGQTTSWYLQSCRFHLQHYLTRGRSLDSKKRSTNRADLLEDDKLIPLGSLLASGCVAGLAAANDDIRVLSEFLTSNEKQILDKLLDGLSLREVAGALGISFPTALKRRRRIAELFKRIERPPLIRAQVLRNGARNGKKSFRLTVGVRQKPSLQKPNGRMSPSLPSHLGEGI